MEMSRNYDRFTIFLCFCICMVNKIKVQVNFYLLLPTTTSHYHHFPISDVYNANIPYNSEMPHYINRVMRETQISNLKRNQGCIRIFCCFVFFLNCLKFFALFSSSSSSFYHSSNFYKNNVDPTKQTETDFFPSDRNNS